jgi:putative PIN family toxin of toxin-antitoxin system
MRVVLDSNVIVSAMMSAGSVPARILHAWDERRFELLVSADMLAEYRRSLGYDRVRQRHEKTDGEVDEPIQNYIDAAIVVQPESTLTAITSDPDDNRVLECAMAGDATHIVSGDRHLLALGDYQEVPILTPRAFLDLLLDEEGHTEDQEPSSPE